MSTPSLAEEARRKRRERIKAQLEEREVEAQERAERIKAQLEGRTLEKAAPSPQPTVPPSSGQVGEGVGPPEVSEPDESPVTLKIPETPQAEAVASASRGVRASHFGPELPNNLVEDLGHDPALPTMIVEKGPLAGRLAVDEAKLRTQLAHARIQRRRREHFNETGKVLEGQDLAQMIWQENTKARVDIREYRRDRIQRGPTLAGDPVPWVDNDPGGQEAFRRWVKEGDKTGNVLVDWNPAFWTETGRKLAAPSLAAVIGDEYTALIGESGKVPEVVTYNEGDAWGFLDWSGRLGASTMLATTLAAAGEDDIRAILNPTKWDDYYRAWGSEEHLKLIQAGNDLFSLAETLDVGKADPLVGNVVSWALEKVGVVDEKQAEVVDDQIGAFLLSVLDLDVLTLATAGAGKAPKLLQKGAAAAVDVIPGARKLESLPGAVMETLRGGDIYGKNLVGLRSKAEAAKAFADEVLNVAKSTLPDKERMATLMAALDRLPPALQNTITRTATVLSGYKPALHEATIAAQRKAQAALKSAAKARKAIRETIDTAQQAAGGVIVKQSDRDLLDLAVATQADSVAKMLMNDLLHQKLAMERLVGGKVTTAPPAGAVDAYKKAVKEANDRLYDLTAQAAVSDVTDPAYIKALVEYNNARKSVQKTVRFMEDSTVSHAAKALDAMIKQAIANEKATSATLKAATDKIEKLRAAGKLTATDEKTVKSLVGDSKRISKARNLAAVNEAYVTAVYRAAKAVAKSYDMWLKGFDDASVAIAKGAEKEAATTFAGTVGRMAGVRFAQGVYRMASEFVDPAKYAYGTTKRELQQIASTSLGEVSAWVDEVTRLVEGVPDDKKAALIVKMLTTTDPVSSPSYTTFMNTFDNISTWDQALPVFRIAVREAAAGTDPDPALAKVLDTIVKSFVPAGSREIALEGTPLQKNVISALNKLLKEPVVTFEEVMETVRGVTAQIGQMGVARESASAYGYAAVAVGEMAVINRAAVRTTKLTSGVTKETSAQLKNIVNGSWERVGSYGELMALSKLADELGLPVTQKKAVDSYGKAVQAGLKAMTLEGDTPVIIPRVLINALDAKAGKVVKELQAFAQKEDDPATKQALQTVIGMVRLINTSLIYGVILPNPAAFTNFLLGNFSQIWGAKGQGLGFGTAVRMTGQAAVWAPVELATHLPYVGKHIDNARAAMADSLGVPLSRVLPSLSSTFYNPHLARFFDPALGAPGDLIPGTKITFQEARRLAADQGVYASFSKTSGLRDALRKTGDEQGILAALKSLSVPASTYAKFMDTVEQRQRVALFLDLLTKGYTPAEAGQTVRSALFDWFTPLSSMETKVASNMLMFYGFTRRAMNQSANILMSAFDEAADDTALDIFIRSSSGLSWLSKLAAKSGLPIEERQAYALERLRNTYNATKSAKEGIRASQDISPEEEAALRRVYPWWAARASNVEFMYAEPLSATDRDWDRQFGVDNTHRAFTVPSGTTLDFTTFLTDQLMLLGSVPFSSDVSMASASAEIVRNYLNEALRDVYAPVLRPLEEMLGKPVASWAKDTTQVKNREDVLALQVLDSLPLVDGLIWKSKNDEGLIQYSTTPAAMAVYRNLPVFGVEFRRALKPLVNNPAIRDGDLKMDEAMQFVSWALGQYLGIGREYRYNPEDVLEGDVKDLKAKVGRQVKQAKEASPLK